MPAVGRVGDECGHIPPPTPDWSPHKIEEGSSNVFVNGKACGRKGDDVTIHKKGKTTHFPDDKFPTIAEGSGSVFVNGKAIARKGDKLDCGSEIKAGSGNVFAG